MKLKGFIRKYGVMIVLLILLLFYLLRPMPVIEGYDENSDNDSKYREFLKGKTVVVVGPADHVNDRDKIDSHDVVVRLNKSIELVEKKPEKYGRKTNIVYCAETNCYGTTNKVKEHKVNFIKFTFPKIENEDLVHPLGNHVIKSYKDLQFDDNMLMTKKDEYLEFEKELQTRPNCGTLAIWDLLKYDIKSLYITGITFNMTSYSKDYREGSKIKADKNKGDVYANKFHNVSSMARYCKDKVITDHRVSYDKEFKESIEKLTLCF
tara:strand:- start:169 stop:960 length:792 start_codon:yes stop_codon:yes gene_type:complete